MIDEHDVLDIINHKRLGDVLHPAHIADLIDSYVQGDVPDYQMAAWLMAVACRGMDTTETAALTEALIGPNRLRLGARRFVADKHSTGGVGDKTSIVLAPLLASVGIPTAKLTGRGLEYAGGTLDKLEAIRGLHLPRTNDEFRSTLDVIGFAMMGQSPDLAPGDGMLYQLRDVTGTVESLPLIASSIMSKKLAIGASALVLDVKAGSGALVPDVAGALTLGRLMVAIGAQAGMPTRAVVSNMEQPLGYAVGNALEVAEAIQALRGEPVPGLVELVLTLGELVAAIAWPNLGTAKIRAELMAALRDGRAFNALRRWVDHHGGDVTQIDCPDLLPRAARTETLIATREGWVSRVDAAGLGRLCQELGAGRTRLGQQVDPTVGLRLHARIGDYVKRGAPLLDLHLPARSVDVEVFAARALAAFSIATEPEPSPPLIYHVL